MPRIIQIKVKILSGYFQRWHFPAIGIYTASSITTHACVLIRFYFCVSVCVSCSCMSPQDNFGAMQFTKGLYLLSIAFVKVELFACCNFCRLTVRFLLIFLYVTSIVIVARNIILCSLPCLQRGRTAQWTMVYFC